MRRVDHVCPGERLGVQRSSVNLRNFVFKSHFSSCKFFTSSFRNVRGGRGEEHFFPKFCWRAVTIALTHYLWLQTSMAELSYQWLFWSFLGTNSSHAVVICVLTPARQPDPHRTVWFVFQWQCLAASERSLALVAQGSPPASSLPSSLDFSLNWCRWFLSFGVGLLFLLYWQSYFSGSSMLGPRGSWVVVYEFPAITA